MRRSFDEKSKISFKIPPYFLFETAQKPVFNTDLYTQQIPFKMLNRLPQLFLYILLLTSPAFSQSSSNFIDKLKDAADQYQLDQTDPLEQFESYFKKGQYEKLQNYAANIEQQASSQNDALLVHWAIHWKNKAIALNPQASKRAVKAALKALENEVDLLENADLDELKIVNLDLMEKAASLIGKNQLARKYRRQIDVTLLKMAERPAPLSVEPIADNTTSTPETVLLKPATISPDKANGAFDKLLRKNKLLGRKLMEQEEEIDQLSEEQMKGQLIIAQQRIILDSLSFESVLDSLVITQTKMALSEKEAQVRLQQSRNNFFIALALIIAIIALGLYSRYTSIKHYSQILEEKNTLIAQEKERSEELLLNILPAAIADELKLKGAATARKYESVSVLFADFKDFSKLIKKFSPENLIAELNYCFSAFDHIIGHYGLEKIKTIGDAYMCAGGLPTPDSAHPIGMVNAALEMQQFLEDRKMERAAQGLPYFEARIGIHTGPIIAGVVGLKKFAYDIWGDTVNIAARLESKSETGKVNISGTTFELINREFHCQYRGKIPAKNVGELDMYYVSAGNGKRKAASGDIN